MFKYISGNNARTFLDVLDLLVDQYNNTIHLSLKMTPKEASRKKNENMHTDSNLSMLLQHFFPFQYAHPYLCRRHLIYHFTTVLDVGSFPRSCQRRMPLVSGAQRTISCQYVLSCIWQHFESVWTQHIIGFTPTFTTNNKCFLRRNSLSVMRFTVIISSNMSNFCT